MNLSERKRKILSAVISENEKTGEPVSSKQLQGEHFSDISPATIRGELATLEELGLLWHPHTSSGRLPTTDGIKFYVNEILTSLEGKKLDSVVKNFNANLDNVSNELKLTAQKISEATNYTAVLYLGLYDLAKIEKVKLLKVSSNLTLVAILTDYGVLEDFIELKLEENELNEIEKSLSSIFAGKTLRDIQNSNFLITQEIERYKFMFDLILKMVAKKEEESNRIEIEGKSKILSQKNTDLTFVKNAMEVFEEPDSLAPILKNDSPEISVEIGSDDGLVKDCAIVTASYKANGKVVGKAGVIGPVRMDYKKVIETLAGISRELSKQLDDVKEQKWKIKKKI